MKKATSIILMALVLVMGLTQCKKNNDINTADNEGEKVYITLMVNQGNGSRLDVDPPHVTFENGDKIYVASNGYYVGTLTHNGTTFEGEISSATEGQPLYFYLLGNVTPAGTLTAGTTTTCSVNISDQTGDLPVIACAPSDQNFGATTNFTATLRNKCALVKFNVTTSSSLPTCLEGFNNKVTVTFGSTDMAYTKEGNGLIKLAAGNGERWAILLPQDALAAGEEGSAYSLNEAYIGTRGALGAIAENGYMTVGCPVTVNTYVVPVGAIIGKFTINANGDQVYFSQGNLQYQASTGIWQFAENQYDYVGGANSNISSTYDGWIDLFGWGTSGFDHGAVCYQPWSTSTDYENDYFVYGGQVGNLYNLNGSPSANIYSHSQTGQADWGYNAISNGSNLPNRWQTLFSHEMTYILNNRSTSSGIRYAKAVVNGVSGLVLLPDNWIPAIHALNNTNRYNVAFTVNEITATEWGTMESYGAVFLPAAGNRTGTSYYNGPSDVYNGPFGLYWLAQVSSPSSAWSLRFNDSFAQTFETFKSSGCSVRLVCDAQ